MKITYYKIIVFTIAVLSIVLVILFQDDQAIFIESKESKTISGAPVFNKIKWIQQKDKDIWMMNQSHHGNQAKAAKWDRLAIVVDKTKSPMTARFYQLNPGPLKWEKGLKEIPFKVSCYICHSNGPRAITPNYNSQFNSISLWKKLKVTYWNLRIKSYGRIVPHSYHELADQNLKRPFRLQSAYENEKLKVNTCMKCHKGSGFFARGALRRQNIPTIKFMIKERHMPPLGFSMTKQEKLLLKEFLGKF